MLVNVSGVDSAVVISGYTVTREVEGNDDRVCDVTELPGG